MIPPPLLRCLQGTRTMYGMGSMPLSVMQEEFLIGLLNLSIFLKYQSSFFHKYRYQLCTWITYETFQFPFATWPRI